VDFREWIEHEHEDDQYRDCQRQAAVATAKAIEALQRSQDALLSIP
jgi:hypothetical protein